MDDTAVEIAKLNETATDLLNKYDNAFDSIDERKDEALNKIKDAYDSGKVAMAENALKLEGKSLQEITEQINTQSILNKPKVKLLQNNNLIDLPTGLNESQSLTLKIEDFDKYTKYFVTTTKGDISLDQNTGEITLKAHEISSDINEELTIEVYYKIGSALSDIFTYKFTVFFLPYEEFTLSNADLKANNEDMDGFEFDGTDALALKDNAFYKEVETKVDDLKVVGETTLLHKGEIIPIASSSTKDRLDSYKEIKQNQELWLGNNKDGYSKNIVGDVNIENINGSTLALLQQTEYITSVPEGLYFSPNGLKCYFTDNNSKNLTELTFSAPFDITNITTTNTTNINSNTCFTWSNDGVHLFASGITMDATYHWVFSKPFDITSTKIQQNSGVNGFTDNFKAYTVNISNDGKKIWYTSRYDKNIAIREYSMSIPYDVSSAVFKQEKNIAPFNEAYHISFSKTGSYILTAYDTALLKVYKLATPFDLYSELTLVTTMNIEDGSRGSCFAGDYIFTHSRLTDKLYKYDINTTEDKYKADISSFNLTQAPTSAQLDTNINISTSVQTSANKIISGEPLELNIDSTSTTTSLVTTGTNLYEGDKLVIDGKEGTLSTITSSMGSGVNTHDIFGDNSAIATYQFNGNVNDLGGKYNASVFGSPIYLDGKLEKGIKLNNSSGDYIKTPNITIGKNWTLSAWVKIQKDSKNNYNMLFSGDNDTTRRFYIYLPSIAEPSVRIGGDAVGSNLIFNTSHKTGDGQFHHVVITNNETTYQVYMDNILLGIITDTTPNISTKLLHIGAYSNIPTGYGINGTIDQVRIFNKALTNSEVQRLYNEEISKFTADISSFSLNNKPKKAYKKQNDKSCITIDTPTTTNISVLNKKQNLITQGQKIFLKDVNRYVDVDSVNESTIQHGISNKEFDTVLYTGNGGNQTISLNNIDTGVDFVWAKSRDATQYHSLFDSIRGTNRSLVTNVAGAEQYAANNNGVTAFNSNSFSLDFNGRINTNGSTHVAWCASLPNKNTNNTDGTITSSTMSNSFMSAISYTGNGNSNSTIGHGLGSTPEFIIIKNRDVNTHGWWVWSSNFTQNEYLVLNEQYPKKNNGYQANNYHGILPNSSSISLGHNSHWTNFANEKFICYSFKSVPEVCKVGSYTGTGTSGNNIDCGFEPAWIMIKGIDDTGEWLIFDYQRGSDNSVRANRNFIEENFDYIDFNSTGFECKNNQPSTNTSGNKYIYIAIAKNTEQTTQKYNITHKAQTSPATGVGLMDTFKTNQILNKTFDGSKISTTLAGQDNIEGEFIQRKIIADKDTKILAPITTSLKKEA